MSKSLDTLVEDIYEIVDDDDFVLSDTLIESFVFDIRRLLHARFNGEPRKATLSASNVGKPCKRELWYHVRDDYTPRPIDAKVKLNFLYGDIIEILYLMLARAAGHKVEGQQDQIQVGSIKGSRDAVIDGVLVDVKSANGRSYQKFQNHMVETDDPFGYMGQLYTYLEGSKDDPLVRDKGGAAFFAINKERGGCVVDYYPKDQFRNITREIERTCEAVNGDEPPARAFEPVADGASGNMKLPVACSYCSYNDHCWPEKRTFLYANGPRHLVHVERKPKVAEVVDGKVVPHDDIAS